MQRLFKIRPDVVELTADGQEIAIVSDEAFFAGMAKLASVLQVSGGVGLVIPEREPSGIPGEMFTTGVVVQWKDRTDGKPAPEQPVRLDDSVAPRVAPPEPEVVALPPEEGIVPGGAIFEDAPLEQPLTPEEQAILDEIEAAELEKVGS